MSPLCQAFARCQVPTQSQGLPTEVFQSSGGRQPFTECDNKYKITTSTVEALCYKASLGDQESKASLRKHR